MAVLIGKRALDFVTQEMRVEKYTCCAWSDSKCVLEWLATKNVDKLSRFEKNRVEEIWQGSLSFQYVPTEWNPADIATRGISLEDIVHSTIWWKAPRWLSQDKSKWTSRELSDKRMEAVEARVVVVLAANDHKFEPLFETSRTKVWSKVRLLSIKVPKCRWKEVQRTVLGWKGTTDNQKGLKGRMLLSLQFCFKSFRLSSIVQSPLERSLAARPLQRIGIDYAGSFNIWTHCKKIEKGLICLLTCLTTRGVHLETVNDFSPSAFLNAYYRVTAQRSVPEVIVSNNGT